MIKRIEKLSEVGLKDLEYANGYYYSCLPYAVTKLSLCLQNVQSLAKSMDKRGINIAAVGIAYNCQDVSLFVNGGEDKHFCVWDTVTIVNDLHDSIFDEIVDNFERTERGRRSRLMIFFDSGEDMVCWKMYSKFPIYHPERIKYFEQQTKGIGLSW